MLLSGMSLGMRLNLSEHLLRPRLKLKSQSLLVLLSSLSLPRIFVVVALFGEVDDIRASEWL